MAEEDWEPGNPWILNKVFDIADRILDSHESANVLIIPHRSKLKCNNKSGRGLSIVPEICYY